VKPASFLNTILIMRSISPGMVDSEQNLIGAKKLQK